MILRQEKHDIKQLQLQHSARPEREAGCLVPKIPQVLQDWESDNDNRK